jgi:UDP-N-acetylmuramoyl-tripeptide--D-alanyl-D-alanine ligase
MICLTLTELANAVNGKLILASSSKGEQTLNNIVTDSRTIKEKDVFLALKGPNFDGHRFIEQVQTLGCCAVIVDEVQPSTVNIAQIIVDDTRIALGLIAAYVKQQVAPKTIGITGSSGKTTVKEMIAAILSRLGDVLATNGNFNNDIGVPLTLLRLEKKHDFAVIEMGANHIGEIAYTTDLVKPDVAIINNIAAAHLEGFGDLCGVARAKGEIFSGLPAGGVALYNQDCKYASKWQWRLTDKKVSLFSCVELNEESTSTSVDIFSSKVSLNNEGCASFTLNTPNGSVDIELTIPGIHNVCNAVAAAAATLTFGASLADIKLGLAQVSPVKGRLNVYQLNDKLRLIDDTYNANVESIKAASELLASYPGKKILILGDMGELGSVARSCHQEVGEHAYQQNIDVMLTLGVLSQSSSDAFNSALSADITQVEKTNKPSQHFSSREQLLTCLEVLLSQGLSDDLSPEISQEFPPISILVKGSRSAHMEHVVEAVLTWHKKQNKKVVVHNTHEVKV